MEQELLTLPEHLSSPPVFSGVRVTRSLALYVCFVDRCLSCTFFFLPLCCLYFDLRILITPLVSSNSSCNGLLESLLLSSVTIDHLCQSIIRDNSFITSQYTKFHSIQKNRCDLHIKYFFQKFTRVIQTYCLLGFCFFDVVFFGEGSFGDFCCYYLEVGFSCALPE